MMNIIVTQENYGHWKRFIDDALKLVYINRNILDKYVLDFFTKDLWNSLNGKWRKVFQNISPQDLSDFINIHNPPRQNQMLPLSLLAMRKATAVYSLPRKPVSSPDFIIHTFDATTLRNNVSDESSALQTYHSVQNRHKVWGHPSDELSKGGQHKLMKHVFRRHLKPKKQHEVSRLAQLVADIHSRCGSELVVDVGSGQGHLSRLLSYGHEVNVFCVDAEDQFINGARL